MLDGDVRLASDLSLAVNERVRPPSTTRVIASLVGLGSVVRTSHPADSRQVLMTVLVDEAA